MALSNARSGLPVASRHRSRRREQGANWPRMLLPALLFFAAFWLLPLPVYFRWA